MPDSTQFNNVIPAKAGIQQEQTSRVADKDGMLFRFADDIQSTGFPPSRE
jgi:hypothetical protein